MKLFRGSGFLVLLAIGGCAHPHVEPKTVPQHGARSWRVAEGFVVQGQVADANGAPVPGAAVMIAGTAQMTLTDSLGDFTLTDLPEDGFSIQIRKDGYRTAVCPLEAAIRAKRFRCDVQLYASAE